MSSAITIRTKRVISNPLMSRKQMVVDVFHPGRANVSLAELREKIAKMFKAKDQNAVVLFNFKTQFGGGKSTGFCCLYDSVEEAKKLHQKHILVRAGLVAKEEKKGRKGTKEAKNRAKKIRGLGRRTARKKAKRADA